MLTPEELDTNISIILSELDGYLTREHKKEFLKKMIALLIAISEKRALQYVTVQTRQPTEIPHGEIQGIRYGDWQAKVEVNLGTYTDERTPTKLVGLGFESISYTTLDANAAFRSAIEQAHFDLLRKLVKAIGEK